MIRQLRIVGEHFEVDEEIKQYVTSKLGKLDKFLPARARGIARLDVMLRQERAQSTGDDTAELLLDVPDDVLKARASGGTMYAAIDAAEAKLRDEIGKYHSEHSPRFYRHLIGRLRGRAE